MAASFLVGQKKILNEIEPRFVLLAGTEYGLKQRLVNHIRSRGNVFVTSDSVAYYGDVFTQALRHHVSKTVYIPSAEHITDWDWLPIWFNRVKNVRIVCETSSSTLATALDKRVNTRGMVVDCSVPASSAAQAKLAKEIALWYNQSVTQVSFLLFKHGWHITPTLELLDKLTLLNLELTSDTMMKLGLVDSGLAPFVSALQDDNAPVAMSQIPSLTMQDCYQVVPELTAWLDRMSRVKVAQGYMKSSGDIAFEVGETKKDVEVLIKQSRRFDLSRINRLALALSSADTHLSQGSTDGVLEVLVSQW